MEQGPIGRTLLVFAAPILLSQILQQMYSIADCMIVGHFGGGNGLAAAGEAALILSVIINFFVGFSTGVSAITASAFGGFQYKKLSRILHSVILMSLIFGAVMTGAGIACSGAFLQWIHCPMKYLHRPGIIFGSACSALSRSSSTIWEMQCCARSVIQSRRCIFLGTFSSALNLLLDLLFIIGLGMGLPGAGMATVIAQWVLAVLMIWKMTCLDEQYQLRLSGLCGGTAELAEIVSTGLPSGMQAIFMSISSLLIQIQHQFLRGRRGGRDGCLFQSGGVSVLSGFFLWYGTYRIYRSELRCTPHGSRKGGDERGVITLSAFTVAAGGILMAVAPVILRLLTTDPEILANGRQAILCIFPFYFLYSPSIRSTSAG